MFIVQACSFLYYSIAPDISIMYKKLTNAWELQKLGNVPSYNYINLTSKN